MTQGMGGPPLQTRVLVFWEADSAFYPGVVTAISGEETTVTHDDGDVITYNFAEEVWFEEVRVGFVGTGDGRLHCLQSCVGDNSDRGQTHGARESNGSSGHFLYNLRAGQSERLGLEQAAELGLGNLMVAADQSHHRFAVGLHIDQSLDEICCRKVQEGGDFFDGPFTRGFDPAGALAP